MKLKIAALNMVMWAAGAWAQDAGVKPAETALKPVWQLSGFSTPESVLYDADTDTYLVSNINGVPPAKDNNGFISEVAADGKLLNLKFIAGGANKVKLHAPKGMGLVAGVLYVADIDSVRMFDRKTGAAKGEVKIPGATFLNDIATTDSRVFVSDSGLKLGKGGLEPSGTDAIYEVDTVKKKARVILKDKALSGPNGLLVRDQKLYVVPFGAKVMTEISLDRKAERVTVELPAGQADGLTPVGTDFLYSSWEAKALFRGPAKGPFQRLNVEITAPADIVYDAKNKRVVVPRFTENTVEAYALE
jgi:hypothetical protein